MEYKLLRLDEVLDRTGYSKSWTYKLIDKGEFPKQVKNSIRGTYNHALYLEGRREMMQWYADYIDELRSKKK